MRNGQGIPHNFHVHNATFTVEQITGTQSGAWTLGPKDTVYIAPGAEVRLAVRFGQYADPEIPYMFHCHLLAHEDAGMMGQYVVIAPGDAAPETLQLESPATNDGSDHGHG